MISYTFTTPIRTKRLGMRSEAYFVEDMMFKGDWADTGIYGILSREWLAR